MGMSNGWTKSVLTTDPIFSVIHRAPAPVTGKSLLVIHGHGSHGGRFAHFPEHLSKTVDSICCVDLTGHGRSPGQRGDIPTFDDYARPLIPVLKKMGGKPHVLGVSMGGLVALRLGLMDSGLPVSSFSISVPLLAFAVKLPVIKVMLGKFLAKFAGRIPIPFQLQVDILMHDRKVQEDFRTDPLTLKSVTPRFYVDMEKIMAETLLVRRFPYPVAFFLAGDDRVVQTPVAREFAQSLSAPKKEIHEFPLFFHDMQDEGGPDAPPGVTKERYFEEVAKGSASN